MKFLGVTALAFVVAVPPMAAADPWNGGDDGWRDGYVQYERGLFGDRKLKARTADGCEIEKQWKKDGEYEEKVKCKPGRW
jgi:hypothetical protein